MKYNKVKEKIKALLIWSQKYTKTDMIYLAKGGFWLTLGQVVSSGSSFFLAIAFANLLPKETYGVYKYVISILGILSIPTLLGISPAITQAVARGYDGSLIPAVKTKIYWGLLGSLASIILAGYYYLQSNNILAVAFLISSIFLPFMDAFSIYESFLQGKKLFGTFTKFNIISQITAVVLMLGTLFFTKNVLLLLFTYFLSWIIIRFIFFKYSLKKINANQNQDTNTISYGKHLSLMGIVSTIANGFDKLLIFHYLGAPEVAIYSIAIAPVEQIKGMIRNINFLVLPKFSQKSREEIKNTISRKIILLVIFLLFITIIYISFAPIIFKWIFPIYPESIFLSQLFALSLVTTALFMPYTALQSQIAKKELYLFNFLNPTIQICLLFIGINWGGLVGVIVARILTRFLNFFLVYLLIKQ